MSASPNNNRAVSIVVLAALTLLLMVGLGLIIRKSHIPLGRSEVVASASETVTDTLPCPDENKICKEYTGVIEGIHRVEVPARVDGFISKMLCSEGEIVKKGQTIFLIDRTVYQADVNKAKAELNKAQAEAKKCQRDLDRIRPLHAQKAASQLELDNAIAAYDAAIADVAICKADLTQANIVLGYTAVKAPIDGYLSQRNIDIGTYVGPSGNSNVAYVVNTDNVYVRFRMPSAEYHNLIRHQKEHPGWKPEMTVRMSDGSILSDKALADIVNPDVDVNTGDFVVDALLDNPEHILFPGERVKITLCK